MPPGLLMMAILYQFWAVIASGKAGKEPRLSTRPVGDLTGHRINVHLHALLVRRARKMSPQRQRGSRPQAKERLTTHQSEAKGLLSAVSTSSSVTPRTRSIMDRRSSIEAPSKYNSIQIAISRCSVSQKAN